MMVARLGGAALIAACLLALATAQTPYPEDYPSQRNCFMTKFPPRKPSSLLFCSKFNDNSCCPPAQDDENLNVFNLLYDTGLSCRLRGDLRTKPLAILYCLNCDPKQPTYVRNMPYYPMTSLNEYANTYPLVAYPSSRSGQWPDQCFNGQAISTYGNNATNYKSCYSTRDQMVLIDRDWLVGAFQIYPNIMSIFDQCMIQKSAPCLDHHGAIIPNRDRFVCGNDLVNPGRMYTGDTAICASNNFTVSDIQCRYLLMERALNQDSLGTPQIDEAFGFRIVDGRCTDAMYQDWVAKYNNVMGSTVAFNAHVLNGPACLMNKTQVKMMNLLTAGLTLTDDYVNDEIAFSSAVTLVPSLLVAVFLAVSMFLA